MTSTVQDDKKPPPGQDAAPAVPGNKPVRTKWSLQHGPVMGPVNAAGALVGLGMVGDLTGVPGWWGALGGAAAALGAGHRAVERRTSVGGIFYRVGCWGAGGGWLSWALATSAWSPSVLAAVAVGTLGVALSRPEMAEHEKVVREDRAAATARAQAAQANLEQQVARVQLAQVWELRLERVCRIAGCTVLAIQDWPNGAGYTLQVRFPEGGATAGQVAKATAQLASDADLPIGCDITVEQGLTKREILIRVATVDATAEPTMYPDDLSELTFNGPLPLGVYGNTDVADVVLLEDPMWAAGRRGSGKTGLLQVVNTALARCPDALIWHIDLNGSGMSLPWIEPWLNGETDQPIVDWVAPTPEEALTMVNTAIDMAKGRKVIYTSRMKAVDDDKLPIDRHVPGIILVLDEGAEAVALSRGHTALAAAFSSLISVARAPRVQLVLSSLRATGDIVPAEMQAQVGTKAFVRPEDKHEIAQMFGWNGADPSDAPHPGSVLIKHAGQPTIRPFRAYRLLPQRIHEIAVTLAPRRPTLDAATAKFGGKAYAERWTRYHAWKATQAGDTRMPATPGTPDAEGQPTRNHPTPNLGNTPAPGVAGLGQAQANLEAAMDRLRKRGKEAEAQNAGEGTPPDEGQVPLNDDAVSSLFEEIVGAEDWPTSGPGEEATPQERMVELLKAAGPGGLHIDDLVQQLAKVGIEKSKPTVYRWLGQARDGGLVRGVDGKDGRWAAVEQRGS